MLSKSLKSFGSLKMAVSSVRSITTKVNKPLPMKDLSLKEHDPTLYKLIEQEKFR